MPNPSYIIVLNCCVFNDHIVGGSFKGSNEQKFSNFHRFGANFMTNFLDTASHLIHPKPIKNKLNSTNNSINFYQMTKNEMDDD